MTPGAARALLPRGASCGGRGASMRGGLLLPADRAPLHIATWPKHNVRCAVKVVKPKLSYVGTRLAGRPLKEGNSAPICTSDDTKFNTLKYKAAKYILECC